MRHVVLALVLIVCSGLVAAQDDGWVDLFNGKDLAGWKLVNPNGNASWTVVDGILTNTATHEAPGTDLMTERKFADHELHVEFRVPPGGNSGVYVQGRFECQVADTASAIELGPGICGGIWATSPPLKNAAKPAGEWQTYDIVFHAAKVDANGNVTEPARMTVKLNGELVQDNVACPKATGGEVDNKVTEPGPLMLQGNHTSIEYRKVRVRPLP
jgi:hypothetical protein